MAKDDNGTASGFSFCLLLLCSFQILCKHGRDLGVSTKKEDYLQTKVFPSS